MPAAVKNPATFLVLASTKYAGEDEAIVGYAKVTRGDEPVETSFQRVVGDAPNDVSVRTDRLIVKPKGKRAVEVKCENHHGDTFLAKVVPGEPFTQERYGATLTVEAHLVHPEPGETHISPAAVRAMTRDFDRNKIPREAATQLRAIRRYVDLVKQALAEWAETIEGANPRLVATAVAHQEAKMTEVLRKAEGLIKEAKSKKRPSPKLLEELDQVVNRAHRAANGIQSELDSIDKDAFRVEGRVRITTKLGANKKIDHWLVRFENEGDQSFIGTAAFAKTGKNAGLGLESMAVPFKGSTAVQRIPFNGNYGNYHEELPARPGATLRVAVRGLGWAELKLPKSGSASLRVDNMVNDIFSDPYNSEYFAEGDVEAKREEKVEEDSQKVKFYDSGKRWMPDDWADRRRYRY